MVSFLSHILQIYVSRYVKEIGRDVLWDINIRIRCLQQHQKINLWINQVSYILTWHSIQDKIGWTLIP